MKKITIKTQIVICLLFINQLLISNTFSSFNKEQELLINSGDFQKPMRITLTTNYQDSLLLRSVCEDIPADKNDETLKRLIDRMYATVTDTNSQGVGIAAPQVGILKNVIWVQRFDKQNEPFEYYINPKILKYSELKQTRREGCLSIPDIMDTLDIRSYSILIQYDNFEQKGVYEMVEGFTAIIFQHEIDHLNGKLFIDYIKNPLE